MSRPHTRLLTRIVVVAAVALTAVPAVAQSASITREPDGTLVFTAAPGQIANRIGVQGDAGGPTITLYASNDNDPATSWPEECVPSDTYGPAVVTCPTPPAVRLDLGDGDDDAYVMDSVAIPVAMFGGSGRPARSPTVPAPTCSTAVPGTTVSSPARATTPCAGVMATDVLEGPTLDLLEGGPGTTCSCPTGTQYAESRCRRRAPWNRLGQAR